MIRDELLSTTFIFFAGLLLTSGHTAFASGVASLPEPVSNNAVASLTVDGDQYVASFAGISDGLQHSDVHAKVFVLDSNSGVWKRAPDLPGGVGRLATTAVAAGDRIYVFGGYTVDADDEEVSTPWVHSFDPVRKEFGEMSPMPVPVDDAVAVSYADRYIYLISGWHDVGNVNLVQVLDTANNTWSQATPIPGNAVFGHAGGIVGSTVLYCDGVSIAVGSDGPRRFEANPECFIGTISPKNHRRIDWHTVESHPGPPRYRMAAAGLAGKNRIAFVGGSDNPYNFNGMGYDGAPSEPCSDILMFDVERSEWRVIESAQSATMDHRGLVPFQDVWLTIGGMAAKQVVTQKVGRYSLK